MCAAINASIKGAEPRAQGHLWMIDYLEDDNKSQLSKTKWQYRFNLERINLSKKVKAQQNKGLA